MTLTALATFTLVFPMAAASPGPTIAALVARVLGRGTNGIGAFCLGLVLGDLTWLVVACFGLAVLAEQAQPVFAAIRYAGAVYLLWLAWALWRAPAAAPGDVAPIAGEGWRLAVTGLAITLGNPKTMLFYLALLPALVDLQQLAAVDLLILSTVLALIYGAVLTGYVQLAARARRLLSSARAIRAVNRSAAAVMAGAAVAVATR